MNSWTQVKRYAMRQLSVRAPFWAAAIVTGATLGGFWVVGATMAKVQVLAALLTPSVAFLAVAVAIAQWRIARNKLKLDLFDRRYAVFHLIDTTLEGVMKTGKISRQEINEFLAGTQSSAFLFDHETYCFTRDIGHRLFDITNNHSRLRSDAPGLKDSGKGRAAYDDAKRWLIDQRMHLHDKFDPYLRVQH